MRQASIIAVALVVAACGSAGEASETTTSTTTPAESTTTAPPETTTTSTTAPRQDEGMVRCESPEGYAISYPEGWETNPGDVVPTCGQFHPEPFEVPESTDERVAAVTAYVDPVPFSEVATLEGQGEVQRAATTLDGLPAIRLEYEVGDDGLWPAGTPITLYAVDVSTGEEDATLILDTVGLESFDYERNQRVLDRMVRTLDVTMEGVDDDPSVVASYEGASGFRVVGRVANDDACLRIPPEGEQVCTELPVSDQLHTIQLVDLEPVLAGVAGSDVFAVTAHLRDGGTSTVLPTPIGEREVGGFSYTVDLDAIEQLVLTDIEGTELRTITPGGE